MSARQFLQVGARVAVLQRPAVLGRLVIFPVKVVNALSSPVDQPLALLLELQLALEGREHDVLQFAVLDSHIRGVVFQLLGLDGLVVVVQLLALHNVF